MKTICILCFLLMFSVSGLMAQQTWQSLNLTGSVQMEYRTSQCSGDEIICLRIVNTDSQPHQVEFTLWPGADTQTLVCSPATALIGDCSENGAPELWAVIPPGFSISGFSPQININ
ncbi:MAG TPA: hypothetical protein PLP34_04175 [Chitinophagaceae bacterium]|nr:hypothetical protein [Chitinophagaceae bacterium]